VALCVALLVVRSGAAGRFVANHLLRVFEFPEGFAGSHEKAGHDLAALDPRQVRYQAALRPDCCDPTTRHADGLSDAR